MSVYCEFKKAEKREDCVRKPYTTLRCEGQPPAEIHRRASLVVNRGEIPSAKVDDWGKRFHRDFECASLEFEYKPTKATNYEEVNACLIEARRETGNHISSEQVADEEE